MHDTNEPAIDLYFCGNSDDGVDDFVTNTKRTALLSSGFYTYRAVTLGSSTGK